MLNVCTLLYQISYLLHEMILPSAPGEVLAFLF